ncbi:MAG: DUF2232 domain-containing protein [Hyphomicrobiales bacterium]
MNAQTIIIALIAGATSFVLMTAGLVGGLGGFPLLALSPLPIVIASLGWGTRAGGIAAVTGVICVLFLPHLNSALVYLAGIGFPAAYLCHLIGLSRQDDPDHEEEWFPVGDIMLRSIIVGGLVFGLGFIISKFDIDEFTTAALSAFEPTIQQLEAGTQQTFRDALTFQIRMLPYFVPATWLLMIWVNIWLGVKVAKLSNRMNRPKFALSDAETPFISALILGVAVVVSFAAPPLSYLGAAFVGASGMALVIMGCVTLHVVTHNNKFRGIMLSLLYASMLFFGFPIFIMAGLGLADLFLKIRQRFLLTNPL